MKNDEFDNFCDWYEPTNISQNATLSFTFFLVRSILKAITTMRRRCIRSDILVENCRYGAERSKVQLRQRAVFPKIMLLQEEANSIVTETVLDSSVGAAAKMFLAIHS